MILQVEEDASCLKMFTNIEDTFFYLLLPNWVTKQNIREEIDGTHEWQYFLGNRKSHMLLLTLFEVPQ